MAVATKSSLPNRGVCRCLHTPSGLLQIKAVMQHRGRTPRSEQRRAPGPGSGLLPEIPVQEKRAFAPG